LEHYLSWFTSNKRVLEAFIQEKAIYKRNSESLSNIVNLANLALEEGMKWPVLNFRFCTYTKDLDLLVQAHTYLIRIKIENAEEKRFHKYQCRNRRVINRI
jgi:hypothetical protein